MEQQNSNFESATMLKKDAVLNVKIGAGYVNRIYKLINYLYKDVSDKDREQFEQEMLQAAQDKDFEKVYDADWKNSIITAAMLLGSIQIAASEQNQTYEQKIDINNENSVVDVFKGLI
jgi:hypothetical protein